MKPRFIGCTTAVVLGGNLCTLTCVSSTGVVVRRYIVDKQQHLSVLLRHALIQLFEPLAIPRRVHPCLRRVGVCGADFSKDVAASQRE
ncbi:hypothetical protein PF008_g16603 [Phytophthora fragariae]|uniref:Uncharacterized protein n=1 Tax=Phytophthora fragariae TaxID=53985 RepID=A0A6G0RBV9_9STRA|nr:hypothetical protein PF008_g16603 [Phytophthora fragariae]